MLKVELTGLDRDVSELGRELQRLLEQYPHAFRAALFVVASDVVTDAMRIVPVDTGFLRSSRFVKRPRGMVVELGFSAPYAIYVHEMHKRYKAGEWKFLQTALSQSTPTMLARIAALTKQFAAAGVTEVTVTAVHPEAPTTGTRPRVRHSRATKRKRALSEGRNRARIARESRASLERQRTGAGRLPRPGHR